MSLAESSGVPHRTCLAKATPHTRPPMDPARNDDLRLRRERERTRPGERPEDPRERPWDPTEREARDIGPSYEEGPHELTTRPDAAWSAGDGPGWDSTARDQSRPWDGAELTGPLPHSNTPYQRPRQLHDEDGLPLDGPTWTRRAVPDGHAPAHRQVHEAFPAEAPRKGGEDPAGDAPRSS